MKRLLLLFFLLIACSHAAPVVEPKPFIIGKRAFEDKLYDVAERQLRLFLQKYPEHASVPEAHWLLGQSLYFQEKYEEALQKFQFKSTRETPVVLQAGFEFWQAQTLSALKRWTEAQKQYQSFIARYPQDEHLLMARLGLASVFFQQEKIEQALAILEELQGLGSKDEIGQQSMLLKAKILINQKHEDQARALLQELSRRKLSPTILFETYYWLGEIDLNHRAFEQALEFYEKITEDKRAGPRELVALAWLGIGKARIQQKKWNAAAQAFERVVNLTQDQELLKSAIQFFLDVYRSSGNLERGIQLVRKWVDQKKSLAPPALYGIAFCFFEDKKLDPALAELERLMSIDSQSSWAAEALLLKSEILIHKGDLKAAEADLQKFIEKSPSSPRTPQVQLQLAQIYIQNKKYEEAAQLYEKISVLNKTDDSFEKAFFQGLAALANAGRLEDFLRVKKVYNEKFPTSALTQKLLLKQAVLLQSKGEEKEARKLLESILAKNSDGASSEQAFFLMGSYSFQNADYATAAQTFIEFEKKFPKSNLLFKATFYRVLCESRMGKLTAQEARKEYQKLIDHVPTHPLAPIVQFQIAQSFYEEQNFDQAIQAFNQFIHVYPNAPLTDQAQYYIGKSWMWEGQFEKAIAIFEALPVSSSLKNDAYLATIDSYRSLGNHEAALKICNALLDSGVQEKSWESDLLLRKISSLYTMGSKNPVFYTDTLKSIEQLFAHIDHLNAAQLNEGGFMKGKILEKLNRPQEAMEAYLDIVYQRLLPQLNGPSQPEYKWFVQCGLEAGRLKEEQGDVRAAIAIYRILERLSEVNREEFSKKITELRLRYFILEE